MCPVVRSKGNVLGENIKAVVLQRMPQSAVCVTAVCVPIDGVIWGVSCFIQQGDVCSSQGVGKELLSDPCSSSGESSP